MTIWQTGNAVTFDDLAAADLMVDRKYLGGSQGLIADDPIAGLLPVGTLGGFRVQRLPTDAPIGRAVGVGDEAR